MSDTETHLLIEKQQKPSPPDGAVDLYKSPCRQCHYNRDSTKTTVCNCGPICRWCIKANARRSIINRLLRRPTLTCGECGTTMQVSASVAQCSDILFIAAKIVLCLVLPIAIVVGFGAIAPWDKNLIELGIIFGSVAILGVLVANIPIQKNVDTVKQLFAFAAIINAPVSVCQIVGVVRTSLIAGRVVIWPSIATFCVGFFVTLVFTMLAMLAVLLITLVGVILGAIFKSIAEKFGTTDIVGI